MTTTTLNKTISYDRTSKDFRAELDGELIGYFGSYHAAEVELDRLAAEQLSRQVVYARPAEEVEPVAAIEHTLTRTYRAGQIRCREYVAASDSGEPLDRFSVYYSDGAWHTWTSDTISQNRIAARHAFAKSLNTAPEPYDDTLSIPASRLDGQCGNCGAALNELGQCERCIEDAGRPHLRVRTCQGLQFPCDKPVAACFHLSIGRDISGLPVNGSLELCEEHAAEWERYNPRPTGPFCFFCGGEGADHDTRDCPRVDDFESTSPSVFDPPTDPDCSRIKQPKRCACGQIAIIEEPAGLFCGVCHEAYEPLALWRQDPTALAAQLLGQPERHGEMAARIATHLAHKTGHAHMPHADDILLIWRGMLTDGEEPPERPLAA